MDFPLGLRDGSGGTSIWDRDFDEFADNLKHESARSAIRRAPWYSQTAETSITHIAFVGGIEEVAFLPCVTSASNVLAIPISPLPGRPTSLQLLLPPSASAEPLYIRAQNKLRVDVRVRVEGAAVFSKTLATFLGLAFAPPAWALVAFAAGQAAYALATFVKDAYFDQELQHLSGAMTAQSVVKHILTEGDKLLISRLSPLADQGGYAIASNYGSLVVRIVFQPIEETSRIFFSKSLSSSPSSSSSENDQEALETAVELLSTLIFTHFLLLLLFSPPYLPLATALVLPPRYQLTSAQRILHAFRFYRPEMAYNGVLEAFLASVCTPVDLRTQSRMMAAASATLI
ncbi:Rft protein-domain-containing protein [Lactarius sanguifluus]|nr:Rft protein-domain-containing protein [Lactarius sanguifluus]